MPLEPGQRVTPAIESVGAMTGVVVRESRDRALPDVAQDGAPRVLVVEWTLEGGETVTSTAAEAALRPLEG